MYNGSDLHICVNELNGAGIALLYVTKDIDGDLRASTPDIEADEFLGDVNDLLLEDEYSICPNSFVTIGNVPMTGVTYSWSSGENSSEITVNSAGEYVVVASNLCGSYSDTNHVIYKPSAVADFSIVNSVGIAITLENNSLNAISYLWNLGDGNSSTDFELSYIYAAEGNYVIELTAYGECDTVITTQIYEAIALSTEVFENGEILLYPNPASEYINIKFEKIELNKANLKIIDIAGKELYSMILDGVGGELSLPLNSLTTGIYTIIIKNDERFYNLKFIKK